jgi:hypothetical protein
MKLEELNVYLSDVELTDLVPEDTIREAISEAISDAVVRKLRRFTEDMVHDSLQEVRDELRRRIQAQVGPRLDFIFQEVVERLDNLTDEQLIEEAL